MAAVADRCRQVSLAASVDSRREVSLLGLSLVLKFVYSFLTMIRILTVPDFKIEF